MGWHVVLMLLATTSWAVAATPADGLSRVRGSSEGIVRAIAEATEQSPTFNQLLADIAATDGVVYVHYGACGRGVMACLVLTVKQAGPYRLLQIRVDPRRKGHELKVSIGHELKHALELLNEPTAVNLYTAHNLYERIASRSGLRFETNAAVRVGLTIDGELQRWRKTH